MRSPTPGSLQIAKPSNGGHFSPSAAALKNTTYTHQSQVFLINRPQPPRLAEAIAAQH
jgi:hypothetical protein